MSQPFDCGRRNCWECAASFSPRTASVFAERREPGSIGILRLPRRVAIDLCDAYRQTGALPCRTILCAMWSTTLGPYAHPHDLHTMQIQQAMMAESLDLETVHREAEWVGNNPDSGPNIVAAARARVAAREASGDRVVASQQIERKAA